jgi:uncharacterized protein with NRDE domain
MTVSPFVFANKGYRDCCSSPLLFRPEVRQVERKLSEMPEKARQMAIFDFLSNTTHASDSALPDTGVGVEWERVLSPALIVTPKYGTRASTILSITHNGDIAFAEHSRAADGSVSSIAEFNVKVHRD